MEPLITTKAAVIERALTVFGDHGKAHKWLNTYTMVFCMTPKQMLERQDGPSQVAKVLEAIAQGGVI